MKKSEREESEIEEAGVRGGAVFQTVPTLVFYFPQL